MSLLERTVPTNVVAGIRRPIFGPDPAARVPITEDELFEVLADSRRRAVIDRLADMGRDAAVAREDLAREIAAAEVNMPPEHVPEERVTPVDTALYRTHLPMLDDADVVRWDVAAGEVTPGRSIDPIAEWLGAMGRYVEPASVPHGKGRIDATASQWR